MSASKIVNKVLEIAASYPPAPSPQPSTIWDGNVPEEFSWAGLVKLDGDDLEIRYRHTLENLGKQGGMLGAIFPKAQN